MAELRQNPLTGEWVILAPERAARPHEFVRSRRGKRVPRYRKDCPFCPGSEEKTPRASLELTDAANGKWFIRAFPNRYPVLSPNADAAVDSKHGIFMRAPAVGMHEVIVESPLHNGFPDRRTAEEFVDLIRAYQLRSAAAMAMPGVAYTLVFKNHGAGAGTSLVHPHSQIIATPVLPSRTERTAQRADAHWRRTGEMPHLRGRRTGGGDGGAGRADDRELRRGPAVRSGTAGRDVGLADPP